jgi:hypothetical protein
MGQSRRSPSGPFTQPNEPKKRSLPRWLPRRLAVKQGPLLRTMIELLVIGQIVVLAFVEGIADRFEHTFNLFPA